MDTVISLDFSNKAVINLDFLLPAAIFVLHGFMHDNLLDHHIQQFRSQLCRTGKLPNQADPLLSVLRGLLFL